MVGPRIYHIKHARSYPAFTADDPAKVMDLAVQWLKRHDFRTKRKSRQYSRGSKKGIHVNFVPKFKLYIEQGPNGHYVVRFDYYAKIKLGTAVVVGVLTSGISTVVGVGTLAIALSDADHFVDKFWKHIDSLARGNPVILTVERWASDGKGGFVKQPLPPGAAVPAGQPLPPPPTPPHGHAPPPPPPMHIDNRPRDNRPPPPIQPGQVYGHSLIQAPVQTNAPPPVPPYYPKLDKSGAIPPPPPATAAAYGNYPPPQSPHGHHYPPPPSPHHAYPHPPPPPHGQTYQAPSGHGYPPPPPAHGYPPPNPSGHGYPPQPPPHSHGHNYQPPTPGGYPPPPPSQHSQRPPPPTQQQRPSAPPQQQAPRRPSNPSQGNYGDPYRSSHDSVQASSHDRYSSQASPHDRYGSQASPHDRYGSQASPHDRYGSQASSHDKYGSQTSSHDKYGSQASSHDEYASQGDSYSAYYDTHGDRQSYYGGDNASQQRYSYSAFTDVDGSYHETSYYEKHASTGSDDIPDSASTFAEQQGLGRYAEHPFFSDKNSQGSKASNPAS